MHRHSLWFDSPLPKLPPPSQVELEESHLHPSPLGPHAPPPPAPLSPWSSLLAFDYRSYLPIGGMFQAQEVIEERVVYSQEEEATPQHHPCVEQLPSTGRKSQLDRPRVRKTRPRDKGLRKLSERAFEIVREMRNATYKDVACRLVRQITEEQFDGESREEQNIKRRVYDALNVLIALGVLRKDGRRIVSEKDFKQAAMDTGCEEIDRLKERVRLREKAIAGRQKQLAEVQNRLACISALLRRNTASGHRTQLLVRFPFVGLLTEGRQQIQSSQAVTIRTRVPIEPFGDIDSLRWLPDLAHDA